MMCKREGLRVSVHFVKRGISLHLGDNLPRLGVGLAGYSCSRTNQYLIILQITGYLVTNQWSMQD